MPSNAIKFDTVTLPVDGFAKVLNLPTMWQGAEQRGSDRLIPGTAGVVKYQRRATVTTRSLEMAVFGDNDISGSAHADRSQGLYDNLDYLRTNVADPTGASDGTRTCTVYLPDGTSITGSVHVVGFEWAWITNSAVRAVMTVSIPAGALA